LTGRTTMRARLQSIGRDADVIPPLLDARITQLTSDRMILTGMERDECSRRDTAQAWMLVAGRQDPKGAGALDTH